MAFLGPSGAGKTTLSLALARAGMAFMGDDLIAVATQNGEIVAHALLFHSKVERVPGQTKEIVDSITTERLDVCHTARLAGVAALHKTSEMVSNFAEVSTMQTLTWLLQQANDVRFMREPQDWVDTASAIAHAIPGWIWTVGPPDTVDICAVKEKMLWG
jgi:ABC-type cobalamin/Fe3+-siderophores transport system ATPase subunit